MHPVRLREGLPAYQSLGTEHIKTHDFEAAIKPRLYWAALPHNPPAYGVLCTPYSYMYYGYLHVEWSVVMEFQDGLDCRFGCGQ